MKKAISALLVAVMILSLAGCASEGQQLYEKYAPIIDMLEAKDYQGAIRDITAMAIEEQKGDVEEIPVMQVLCDTWYTTYEGAPEELTFSEDGTCTIGGKSMTWLAEETGSDSYLRLQISEDGKICRYVSLETGNNIPYLHLSYAEERDDGIYSGEGIGTYYNHPMIPQLLRSWRAISEYERVGEIQDFSVNTNDAYILGDAYVWSLLESENEDTLTIHIDGKNDREGAYTVTLTMRDGYPVVTFTDDSTGVSGLYYSYEYGYDRGWPEYIYAKAMENLNEYLENGSFWCSITELSYSDHDDNALAYLYDQFVSVGDYADAAQTVENWDSVRFNRAMRLLNYYLNDYSFTIGETYYRPSENALEYIYTQFAELSGYAEADAILDRFTILEDVFLKSTYVSTDNMGNVRSESTEESREYNALGQMIRLNNYSKLQRLYGTYDSNGYYTYDDNGVITEIKIGNVSAVITPSYDENGNRISDHVLNNDGEFVITYTYDDQNRLIEMRRPRQGSSYDPAEDYYFFAYTYDDAGRLIRQVYGYVYNGQTDAEYITEYTYDAAGNQIAETYTYNDIQTWNNTVNSTCVNTAECVCDDQGRVIQKNWTYGNTVYQDGTESKPDNASSVYTYTYGDVYFFDSTGMVEAE